MREKRVGCGRPEFPLAGGSRRCVIPADLALSKSVVVTRRPVTAGLATFGERAAGIGHGIAQSTWRTCTGVSHWRPRPVETPGTGCARVWIDRAERQLQAVQALIEARPHVQADFKLAGPMASPTAVNAPSWLRQLLHLDHIPVRGDGLLHLAELPRLRQLLLRF